MKLTLQLKLLPTPEQAAALLDTMRRFNEAATFAAEQGFAAGVYSAPSIQKFAYRECRGRFGLSAQMAVRAIGKAAECFAHDKTKCPAFRPTGAMTYDERILSFKGCHKVGILTVSAGRVLVPYVFGEYQAANLARIRGQCDLVYRDGLFFLYCTIKFAEPPPVEVGDFLGVDLGIVNLAADSDGNTYVGEFVEKVRRRYAKTRRNLQRRGTKSARRILKRIRRRESRFRRQENHVIAKKLVAAAKGTTRGIALEDLRHIRTRVTVGRRQRARHSGWAFAQLRAFVEYKAKMAGVPVVAVDPRDSSRTCSACGHCEKANRRSQKSFACLHCDFSCNADLNAARNLRARAKSKLASSAADHAPSRKAAGL
ncbi:MAG TPA: transposase [Gemmataceae bacterium]|nr:transposase [Gemmataceae bacterium]